MQDLNFFEQYKKQTKKTGVSKNFLVTVLLLFVILVCVIFMIFRQFKVKSEENNVANLDALANDPATLKKVEKIEKKREALAAYNTSIRNIEDLDTLIQSSDLINDTLFAQITERLPLSVYLNTINVQSNGFNISGVARDKYSVADFQRELKSIPNVTDVFTSNIDLDENLGLYNYTLNVAFNEVDIEELFSKEEENNEEAKEENPDKPVKEEERVE